VFLALLKRLKASSYGHGLAVMISQVAIDHSSSAAAVTRYGDLIASEELKRNTEHHHYQGNLGIPVHILFLTPNAKLSKRVIRTSSAPILCNQII